MEGDPALIVGLVDAGSVLHQESHHVDIVIDACLREEREGRAKHTERTRGNICTVCRKIHSEK